MTTQSCATQPSTRNAWTPSPPSASGCVGPAAGQPRAPTQLTWPRAPSGPPPPALVSACTPPRHCTLTRQTTRAAPTLTLVLGRPGVHQDGPGVPGTPTDADCLVTVCRDPVNPRCRHSGGQAHGQRASLCQVTYGGGEGVCNSPSPALKTLCVQSRPLQRGTAAPIIGPEWDWGTRVPLAASAPQGPAGTAGQDPSL